MAEDLDSLLLMTGSTCLGKLTVEAEHLPTGENATDNNCSRLRTETTPVWGTTLHDVVKLAFPSIRIHTGGRWGGSLRKAWEGSGLCSTN